MASERRDVRKRAEVFQKVRANVVENPSAAFEFEGFHRLLGVPEAAARRILANLINAGVVEEVGHGRWARTWSHISRFGAVSAQP
jgi:DNA-binding IclR family transcriptional regulator